MRLNVSHLVVVLFVFMLSCGDSSSDFCLSNQMSAKATFYSSQTSTETADSDTSITDIVIRGIYPFYNDSVLNDTSGSTSFVYFPLSMESDSTEFLLESNSRQEAIKFFTSKELNYVSEECGFIFDFYIDSIKYTSTYFVDSIVLINNKVIYSENTDNVKIYFFNN